MEQSKLQSFIESVFNTLIGFVVTFLAWPIAAAIFRIDYNIGQQWGVVAFFTFISVIRSYIVRRYFNARLHETAKKLANLNS